MISDWTIYAVFTGDGWLCPDCATKKMEQAGIHFGLSEARQVWLQSDNPLTIDGTVFEPMIGVELDEANGYETVYCDDCGKLCYGEDEDEELSLDELTEDEDDFETEE